VSLKNHSGGHIAEYATRNWDITTYILTHCKPKQFSVSYCRLGPLALASMASVLSIAYNTLFHVTFVTLSTS